MTVGGGTPKTTKALYTVIAYLVLVYVLWSTFTPSVPHSDTPAADGGTGTLWSMMAGGCTARRPPAACSATHSRMQPGGQPRVHMKLVS